MIAHRARRRTGLPSAAVKTLNDASFLDMFSAAFQADPRPVINDLRQQGWLVRTAMGGLVISRPQVQALLADTRLRSAVPDIVRLQGVTDGGLAERLNTSIIALEGDDHTRLRKLVSRAFTPRATDVHREELRSVLHALVDPLAGAGHCEFMAQIADHYPIQVMCHLLGVPGDDHEDFARWNRSITRALSFQLGAHLDEVEWGLAHMSEYVHALTAERRRRPQDDLVTALVQASEDRDRLSDEEVFSLIATLLFAGYDTTRNQIGLAMWLFAEHPDQWERLRADPALAPRAVEEVMRFHGAVGATPRVVIEAFELDGFRIEEEAMLMLSTSAANHDPAAYDDPWSFDITAVREPHSPFGGGPHFCLGASLARAEMQEALPILAAAMPDLALDGEATWRPPFGIYGPETLPLRFGT